MATLRLPSRKDIREVYQQGKDVVLALVQTTFSVLAKRIQKLDDQLIKNSRNSGKPLYSDCYEQPASRSLRKLHRRKSKGQMGFPGETLKAVIQADHVQVHRVLACRQCSHTLKRLKALGHEKQRMFDLPQVQIEVTEQRAEIKGCGGYLKEARVSFLSG